MNRYPLGVVVMPEEEYSEFLRDNHIRVERMQKAIDKLKEEAQGREQTINSLLDERRTTNEAFEIFTSITSLLCFGTPFPQWSMKEEDKDYWQCLIDDIERLVKCNRYLKKYGAKDLQSRIPFIKEVRERNKFGLKQSKEIVDFIYNWFDMHM